MKTAIITGASRGIGKECALFLADKYDFIGICSSKSEDELMGVKDSILKKNTSCKAFVGDVSQYHFVSDMIAGIFRETGRIDLLINNAGISSVGLFTDTTPDIWQTILNTNLTSVYNCCHAVLPHMIHEKSGRILNVSSVWGLVGASCEVAYSAAKGGINSFTKALAKELAPSNISVNAIAFGAIDTSMNHHLSPQELSSLCEEIPAGRMATAKEAAQCISSLLDMPSYLTGEIIKFDGGWI